MNIAFCLFLIATAVTVAVTAPLHTYAISTSTESEQPTNQILAADKIKDEVSSELRSIAEMAPLEIDYSEGPFYITQVTKNASGYLSERFSIGTLSGSGTIRLPDSTSPLNFTSTGTEITDSARSAVVSNETITQDSGIESAKVSMFQVAHYRSDDGIQRNAVIAIFSTNATGQLAALDGLVGIGESELTEGGAVQTELWRLG